MELLIDPRNISRDQKCVGSAETAAAHHTRQATKLRDVLFSDKPNLLYADFRNEITRNSDDVLPKHLASQQSLVIEKTHPKELELVRYMSNLPSYLEKGKNFQEKALNVGVLDWRRLEKWRYTQKQMPDKHSGYSPSSSTFTLSSSDGLSTHSTTGTSCSPASQRKHRLSLQSPLEASPNKGHAQDAESSSGRGLSCSPVRQRMHHSVLQSHTEKANAGEEKPQDNGAFGGNAGKFQDLSSDLSRQQKSFEVLQRCERKESGLQSVSEMGKRPAFNKYEVSAPWKGKTKIQGRGAIEETQRLQGTKLNVADRDCSERGKSGMPVMPRDSSEKSSGVTASPHYTVNSQLSVESGKRIISGRNISEDPPSPRDNSSNHLGSTGPFSQDSEGVKNSSQASNISLRSSNILDGSSRTSAQGVKGPSRASHMLSFPARMLSSPSRSQNTEEKKQVTGVTSSSAAKPTEELRKSSESILKTRHPLPIRRLSFAMGKMIRSAGSRDNSPVRRSVSNESVAKSGLEGTIASKEIDNPCSDKLSLSNNRGRSSPLRRLLDPLLKSRTSSSPETSKKNSSSRVGSTKSCNEQLDFSLAHSVKVKSGSSTGCTASFSGVDLILKDGSSSLQALLQVSFKNGLPLLTFAIDNGNDILAATVRKSSVRGKGHHSWTYTFFTIREVKRKSGIRFNQGVKGESNGYVPNVVAQMKVSDSQGSPFSKHENADYQITREFDLFAVDMAHGDQYATDFHPTNELAAIVIRLQGLTAWNPSEDGQLSYNWLDSSEALSMENSEAARSYTQSDDSSPIRHSSRSSNLSTTVILPGGVHAVPSKGEISTLAQRWRSGGSCDCGGWDLGCQLRVFTNEREFNDKMYPSVASLNMDKFQLFSKVGQDNQLVLSLAPFKEKIYSVEFSSSLSVLQAFAICISFIDRRRPPELSEPSNVVEKITNHIGGFEVPTQTKTSNHHVEAPARYISYPPHSPVGRV